MLQVQQTTLKLLMLVSDVKVNSRLKNTQRNFQWNPWNALNSASTRRKNDTLSYNRGTYAIFATGTKLLGMKSEVYRPGGDLVETNN